MSQVVRIPSKIYRRLEQHANGFDTPVKVIERLLDYYEENENIPSTYEDIVVTTKKNISKYNFEGLTYGKGRLVLAVVKHYVSIHPMISLQKLQAIFPKHIQGSSGVFNLLPEAQEIYERTGHKRHFIKSTEIIKLSDCEIAVSTEWGKGNIDNFIEAATSQSLVISEEE